MEVKSIFAPFKTKTICDILCPKLKLNEPKLLYEQITWSLTPQQALDTQLSPQIMQFQLLWQQYFGKVFWQRSGQNQKRKERAQLITNTYSSHIQKVQQVHFY